MKKIKIITLALSALLCIISCQKTTNGKTPIQPQIQYVKTVLGGCNNGLPGRGYIEEKDTLNISVSDDSIHVFVGFTYTCKGESFKTKVETIDSVICMYIDDRCYDDNNNEIDCGYMRCYCYYTFNFAFHYEGEINQKYKILLYGSSFVGGEYSVSVISEGVLNTKNR